MRHYLFLLFSVCFALAATAQLQFYGTTLGGGPTGHGSLYTIKSDGSGFQNVRGLFTPPLGWKPTGGVVEGDDGKLYGTTEWGGISWGSIYSYNPTTNTYAVLYEVTDELNGKFPLGHLLKYKGVFYGLMPEGGLFKGGVMYRFNPTSSEYTVLFNFSHDNGTKPYGSLILAKDGKFYGSTSYGGAYESGSFFSYDPETKVFTKILDRQFWNSQASEEFLQASDGKLYGVTQGNGSYLQGSLYSFDLDTRDYTVLYNFNISDGYWPTQKLLEYSPGLLLGFTGNGGVENGITYSGVLFSFNYITKEYKKLYHFKDVNGNLPNWLLKGSDGRLYGYTFAGGVYNNGIFYTFDLGTNSFTKLADFTGDIGQGGAGMLLEYKAVNIVLPVSLQQFSATKMTESVHLQWLTTAFENMHYYEIERSVDGANFSTIGRVNSYATSTSYDFDDRQALTLNQPIFYYRLKLVENNGTYKYSNIVTVDLMNTAFSVTFAPNPVRDNATLNVNGAKSGKMIIEIIDLSGRTLMQLNKTVNGGVIQLPIEVNSLAPGSYMLRITNANNRHVQQFIKQ